MSLINQMLQDLESRRVGGTELGPLPNQVRLLPRQEGRAPWARIGMGILLACLVAGGVIFWHYAKTDGPASPSASTKTVVGAPQTAAGRMPPPAPPLAAQQPAPPAAAQSEATTAPPAQPAAPAATEPAPSQSAGGSGPRPVPAAQPEASSPAPSGAVPAARTGDLPAAMPPVGEPGAERPAEKKSASAIRRSDTELKVSTSLTLPAEYLERSTPPATSTSAAPAAAKPAARTPRRKAEEPPSIEMQMRAGTAGERAENEYRKAVVLLKQGRMSEAFDTLRGALQADAGHAGARLLLTGLLLEQKRLDEAQALLREGLALNPAQPQLAMRQARIQVERGELGGAMETLQKAAPAATDSAEFRGFHAAVLQRLGRHAEAVLEFQAALRLAPQSGIWWMGLGISLEEDHRAAEAREAYQKARSSGSLSQELDQFVARKLKQLQ